MSRPRFAVSEYADEAGEISAQLNYYFEDEEELYARGELGRRLGKQPLGRREYRLVERRFPLIPPVSILQTISLSFWSTETGSTVAAVAGLLAIR
jgi:hypothetical protein